MTDARRSLERLIAYILVAVAVATMVWLLLPLAWRYLSPFIIAIPFASLVQPASHFLEKKLKWKHTIAGVIPVVVLFLLIAAMLTWFLAFGFNQISYLLTHSSDVVSEGSALIRRAVNQLLAHLSGISQEDATLVRSISENIISWLSAELTSWAAQAVNLTVGWATSIPDMLLYANFLVFGIYFIAKDYDRLTDRYHKGMFGNPDTSTGKITNSALVGLMGWLRCQSVYALLSLIAGSIYWTAFGYQYGILISVCAAILEFLPIVGNGTIYHPWGIIGLLVGRPRGAILALILYFTLLFIRRMTEHKLLSTNIGVSPLLSLMSMFAGLRFGGIIGMIGSTMIAAVLTTLWEGEFRRTIRYDAHIVFSFLAERWNGISAPREEVEIPAPQEKIKPKVPVSRKRTRKKSS